MSNVNEIALKLTESLISTWSTQSKLPSKRALDRAIARAVYTYQKFIEELSKKQEPGSKTSNFKVISLTPNR